MYPRPITPFVNRSHILMFLPLHGNGILLLDNLSLVVSDNDLPLLDAELPSFDFIPIPTTTFLFGERGVKCCCVDQWWYMWKVLLISCVLVRRNQMLPKAVKFLQRSFTCRFAVFI